MKPGDTIKAKKPIALMSGGEIPAGAYGVIKEQAKRPEGGLVCTFNLWPNIEVATSAANLWKVKPKPAGLRERRRNRQTGFLVGLYNSKEAGFDSDGGEGTWSIVCEEHHSICSFRTYSLARSWMSQPHIWCAECRKLTPR